MILKFESRISNTHVHPVAKLQVDPTVELGDMRLQSGLICTGRFFENGLGPFLHALWTWAFILDLTAAHLLMGLEKAH